MCKEGSDLKLVCDLAVRQDTSILCTIILLNLQHSYRSLHLQRLRLDINCSLKLVKSPFSTLREDGILLDRSFSNIAFFDRPVQCHRRYHSNEDLRIFQF